MTRFFLNRLGRGVAVPPGSDADLTVSIRSTENKLLDTDMAAILAAFSDTGNRITVTVEGSIPCCPWPWEDQRRVIEGLPKTFVKARLQDHLGAITSATSAGTHRWTLTGYAGANGTSPITRVIAFTVTDAAPTTYTIGQRTRGKLGGYPIHKFLPGNPGDWSFASGGNPSSYFEIVNADNATAALATKRYVTWAAASYGAAPASRTVGATPTLGPAAYSVTLENTVLGLTHTLDWTVNVDELNAAPNALNDSSSGDTRSQVARYLNGGTNVGDRIVCEDGLCGYGTGSVQMVNPTTRVGGPVAPFTDDDPTNGGDWDHLTVGPHPGWVTITSREPLKATFDGFVINYRFITNGDGGVRLYQLDLTEGLSFTVTVASHSPSWCLFDHCKATQIVMNGGATGTQRALFAWDNWFADASDTEMAVRGYDIQVIGNWGFRAESDFCKFGGMDSDHGTGTIRSRFNWNTRIDQKRAPGVHPDFIQGYYKIDASTVWAEYDAVATNGTVVVGQMIGNIVDKGEGSLAAEGDGIVSPGVTALEVGQAHNGDQGFFFNSDVGSDADRPDLRHLIIAAGNALVTNTVQSFQFCQLADGSVIANNTASYPFAITAGAVSGTGYYAEGPLRFNTETNDPDNTYIDGTSAGTVIISRNAFSKGALSLTGATANNNVNLAIDGDGGAGAITSAEAAWVNPTEINRNLEDTVANMAANPSGSLISGATLIGALGDTTYIDHERRTYDPAKLLVA